MALPKITLNSIVREALRRAGDPDPDAALVRRTKEVWMPELVNEIVTRLRQTGQGVLKVFSTTVIAIPKVNQRRYALPTDFDEELNVTILDGDTTGTVQTASSSSVTLAASDTLSVADAEGRHVLITAGVAKGQYRQITDYDATTKVATVELTWDTKKTPTSTDTYRIIDEEAEMCVEYVRQIDELGTSRTPGKPDQVTIYNEDLLFNRPFAATFGIKIRYNADPAKVDTTDKRWTDLYTRWQSVLTHGLKALAEEDRDDDRALLTREIVDSLLPGVLIREQPEYGEFEGFTLN